MRTEKKQKEEAIEANLLETIKLFYTNADIMSCIDAVTYLTFSIDEDIDPLTSVDNIHMRSLMRLLIDLSRLQTTGRTCA